MNPERWRLFVAVELEDDLRRRLADAIATWRLDPRTDGLRWVEPDALHLTLAFLGATAPARVGEIEAAMRGVAPDHPPFALPTGRLGAFPRPGSARVVWYAVDDADGRLASLASDLRSALDLDDADPWRAHVTVARARRRPVDVRGWIEEASAEAPTGLLAVAAMSLVRSHVGSCPARYERLASVSLGSASESQP
ncbi:MAG TPA: RNA 2',3'-cyclic phosphodiesterase [Candidatus Limnocylindria bacterium]|nr:RNA 2',3'-cyclic phosphodiesterase [Candidatus Limnocylindria bacterium]